MTKFSSAIHRGPDVFMAYSEGYYADTGSGKRQSARESRVALS